ncbi:cell division protein [Beggiatoa alba B18LD]|uniref:Cell division protein n=1 Tax=Beggiatoa alba B18LD TaxID=395493 RepID=I3CEI3_9GAMM|nr:SPOR domain-containing protein [Beggiatoa alba]EIJ42026.1 cell division protein [Beggiatoa alba B18LD]
MAGNQRRLRREDVQSCPPWAWFLGGVLLGIFLSFLVYLREIAPYLTQAAPTHATETPVDGNATVATASTETAKIAEKTEEKKPKTAEKPADKATMPTHFEFYDVLKQPSVLQPSPHNPVAEAEMPPIEDSAPLAVQTPGTYLLQAGAFRDRREAEGLKVHLANLGLIASIEEATLDNTGVWYRVRLGPFTDLATLNQVRSQLSASNITSVILRF